MIARVLAAVVAALLVALVVADDSPGLLVVRGPGAAEKGYEIGEVEFLGISVADQLVHYAGGATIPLRLSVDYEVRKPAPVILNSRLGTEYWRLVVLGRDGVVALHTDERIDLARAGRSTTSVDSAVADEKQGVALGKGAARISGHYYFLIDQENRQWLDVINPPALLNMPEVLTPLQFTLCNLERYSVQLRGLESTWEPGGLIRAELVVTDADGDQFPVASADAVAKAGEWSEVLRPQVDWLGQPTGWLVGRLPADAAPEAVEIEATVSAATPRGIETQTLTGRFAKGHEQRTAAELTLSPPEFQRTRDAGGNLRETRAIWVGTNAVKTSAGIAEVVQRCKKAGLNAIIVDVYYADRLLVPNDICSQFGGIEEGLDPLAALCEKAHAEGIDVHAWFCLAYPNRDFGIEHPTMAAVDRNGGVIRNVGDLHREQFRDRVANVMLHVARNYPVDGLHFDYIRTKADCYCDQCRAEFAERFGKPLTEASDDEWTAWNQPVVAEVVRRVSEQARAVRPDLIMSAAVYCVMEWGARQGQDAPGWVRNGWVDVCIPMDYSSDVMEVRANEQAFLDALGPEYARALASGLSLYMDSGGSQISRPPDMVATQIHLVRTMGINGYCLFAYEHMSEDILDLLRTKVNAEPAVPAYR